MAKNPETPRSTLAKRGKPAEDALRDRVLFQVSAKNYAAFEERLDAPPNPNPRLRRTMKAAFTRDE